MGHDFLNFLTSIRQHLRRACDITIRHKSKNMATSEKINLNEKTHEPGTLVTATESPLVQLRIVNYQKRIYYCEKVGHETDKQLAYFHHELQLPNQIL